MATISTTIPDELFPRVRDALRGIWDNKMYPDTGNGYMSNPIEDMTDIEALQWIISEYIRKEVIVWEASQASKAAETAAMKAATKQITGIS